MVSATSPSRSTATIWRTHFYGGGITRDWTDLFNPVTYNPPGDGRYRFVSIARENNRPGGNREQTILHPITITVDSLPPTIPTFDSTVITTAHRTDSGMLVLTGNVTDLVEVRDVHVDRHQPDEDWFRAAHDGMQWSFPWPSMEEDADPTVYTVTVKASDIADHVSQITQTITFDMVPPELVTPTLSYVQPGLPPQEIAIEPGRTITDSSTLKVEWTPSSDGNGVLGYRAGWTTSPTDTTGLTFQPHTAASTYNATQLIGEAQTVYAHVVSIDNALNQQPQVTGPVYVDAPTTPDIIAMGGHETRPYAGWMDSGCTLMGVDRRVETHAVDGAALDEPQKFYATWNAGRAASGLARRKLGLSRRPLRLLRHHRGWRDDALQPLHHHRHRQRHLPAGQCTGSGYVHVARIRGHPPDVPRHAVTQPDDAGRLPAVDQGRSVGDAARVGRQGLGHRHAAAVGYLPAER